MRPFPSITLEEQLKVARLYKSGMSAQQVADERSVSLKTVYNALRRQGVNRRTIQESNRLRFEAKPLSFSIKLDLSPAERDLKLAAVMLYWAEGYKVGRNTVDFANSDPDTGLIFIRFLREVCRVDESRLRCHLYCYEGQNIASIKAFWSKTLEVPEKNFVKPYIKKGTPGSRGPRMIHGLVHIRYCDTKLLRQILVWIDEYRASCVGGRVVNYTSL